MDFDVFLVKTALGREALAQRAPGLGPRLRAMLIMVDGKHSTGELEDMVPGALSAPALLQQLLDHGWVAPRDLSQVFMESSHYEDSQLSPHSAVPVAEADVSAGAFHGHDVTTLPFAQARIMLARFIHNVVGPFGVDVAIRIESCQSAAELQACLPRIREALLGQLGPVAVQRFDVELVPRLPRV